MVFADSGLVSLLVEILNFRRELLICFLSLGDMKVERLRWFAMFLEVSVSWGLVKTTPRKVLFYKLILLRVGMHHKWKFRVLWCFLILVWFHFLWRYLVFDVSFWFGPKFGWCEGIAIAMICNVPGSLCVLRVGKDHSKKGSILSIDTATSWKALQVEVSSTMMFLWGLWLELALWGKLFHRITVRSIRSKVSIHYVMMWVSAVSRFSI